MWQRLKRDANELRQAKPGSRFRRFHRRRTGAGEHRLVTALYIASGIALIIVGIILSISPIVPGFFLVIAGVALIVARARPVALWLDRVEVRLRASFARVTGRDKKSKEKKPGAP